MIMTTHVPVKYISIVGNKIPGKRPDGKFTSALDDKKVIDVVKAYFIYNHNATKSEEYLPYTRKTIIKYWKMSGLDIVMGAPKKKKEKSIRETSIKKPDTFLNKINNTKEWINKNIEDYRNTIESIKMEIENIDKTIKQKKNNREKLVSKIKELEYAIEDCFECSLGFLEFTEDICNNREKSEFYKEYGCSYRMAENKTITKG